MPRTSGKARGVEARVGYSVGHRVRVDIICALNDGAYCIADLCRIVKQPMSTVGHHVEELLKDGSIFIVHEEPVGNGVQYYYRASVEAMYDDEEMAAWSHKERQEFYGAILQASMAEVMSSFYAGKISEDPRSVMLWKWFNVDQQGRDEIADEQTESWNRLRDIETRATERCEKTGEETTSLIVTSLGYPRARDCPIDPKDIRDSPL